MSNSPRTDLDRAALAARQAATWRYTHITDADGYPLCCDHAQPAPAHDGDPCPSCASIARYLPDDVVVRYDVEPLPFDATAAEDKPIGCPNCNDGIVYEERVVNGTLHMDPAPCACQTGRR